MGIDYYTCSNCQHNFPDCGDFHTCSCERHFCSTECAKIEYLEEDDEEDENDYDYVEDKTTCLYCRGDGASHEDLFYFLLRRYSISEEEALELYKKDFLENKRG